MQAARARGDREVLLSAQTHAMPFYERFGFVAEGGQYDDAGIAHRMMRRVF
jgi:predicted GNAT family N-acyltransferase